MKTLSLWQPWASLVVAGIKHYETRSWKPPQNILGQRIAIHAANQWKKNEIIFWEYLHKYYKSISNLDLELPRGCILGTIKVVGYLPTSSDDLFDNLSDLEKQLGDYSIDRYAWFLEEPELFKEPIPTRGYQRLWEWNNE